MTSSNELIVLPTSARSLIFVASFTTMVFCALAGTGAVSAASKAAMAPRLDLPTWSNDATANNALSTAANSQLTPTIATDGSGGAIVTWQDNRSDSGDIYAQRIDANGIVQ